MSNQVSDTQLTVKLVRLVGERERRVYARQGVTIRVGSIAHDGNTLICTVFQHRKSMMSKPLDTVEMVSIAENVLAPLLTAGYIPMITAMDWAHSEDLRGSNDRPDDLDPIGLISALRDGGLPFPRLNTTSNEPETPILEIPIWRKALSMFAAW